MESKNLQDKSLNSNLNAIVKKLIFLTHGKNLLSKNLPLMNCFYCWNGFEISDEKMYMIKKVISNLKNISIIKQFLNGKFLPCIQNLNFLITVCNFECGDQSRIFFYYINFLYDLFQTWTTYLNNSSIVHFRLKKCCMQISVDNYFHKGEPLFRSWGQTGKNYLGSRHNGRRNWGPSPL